MSDSAPLTRTKSDPVIGQDTSLPEVSVARSESSNEDEYKLPSTPGYASSTPGSPYFLSRNSSYIGSQSLQEDWETPLDKLTFFDIFDNLALPAKLEKWQATIAGQRENFKKSQERIRHRGTTAKERAMAEIRRRVPSPEEQLAKYRSRMKKSVDNLNKRWSDVATITTSDKVSFISAVLNIFISGYLIGAVPEKFYYWFTAQFLYFMPIRFVTYHRKGYHYFLADLCYFVNFLLLMCVWLVPSSKRLLISTYCLAYGNNAIAIVMWRNSLVFHSLDKVTSLFIHVMPPVTLHCMVHLTSDEMLLQRFPAIYKIKYSNPGSSEHYSLGAMLIWATCPYAIWQLTYHFLITVRRREKIAAGRPTSFTWLRKSYANTIVGKMVLSLPEALHEVAFMLIQYGYALVTIVPCPIWFWYRWPSAGFLMLVFMWSIWNGANYYMDVFGKRFEKELEQMKRDVAKWQNSPGGSSGLPETPGEQDENKRLEIPSQHKRRSIDQIPLLDENGKSSSKATGAEAIGASDGEVTSRK